MTESRVWKFEVPVPRATCRAFIDVPEGTELLSVGLQDDQMVVWGSVPNPFANLEMRRLLVANTGTLIPGFAGNARFLGTVWASTGIVWHVWDGDA